MESLLLLKVPKWKMELIHFVLIVTLGLCEDVDMLWDCPIQVTLHPPLDIGGRAACTVNTTSVDSASEESPPLPSMEGRRHPHWHQASYNITVTVRYSAHSFFLPSLSMAELRPTL